MTNRTANKNRKSSQPLSAWGYVLVALVGLLIGIGLLFFYAYQVPKLTEWFAGRRARIEVGNALQVAAHSLFAEFSELPHNHRVSIDID